MSPSAARQTGKTFITRCLEAYNQIDPAVRRRWRQQSQRGRFVHAHKRKRLRTHFVGNKFQ